jgi:hypothetical protein
MAVAKIYSLLLLYYMKSKIYSIEFRQYFYKGAVLKGREGVLSLVCGDGRADQEPFQMRKAAFWGAIEFYVEAARGIDKNVWFCYAVKVNGQ